ncbi:organomercurial lyase, partial [Nonomuraea sp. NPDC049709]|uniref:organomercurial lyase n=1 Tax=Nonomuraea sp. NPDC049709 TaxID=3154736 RepID=UPI00342F5FD0
GGGAGAAAAGAAPPAAELTRAAAPYGVSAEQVLAELHAADFLRLDDRGEGDGNGAGQIRAAYPFSASPTRHRVQINGGPAVFAMCAIDALGIAAMLGRDVRITSADPLDERPVTVEVTAAGQARWAPASAVVFAGQQALAAHLYEPRPRGERSDAWLRRSLARDPDPPLIVVTEAQRLLRGPGSRTLYKLWHDLIRYEPGLLVLVGDGLVPGVFRGEAEHSLKPLMTTIDWEHLSGE